MLLKSSEKFSAISYKQTPQRHDENKLLWHFKNWKLIMEQKNVFSFIELQL